MDLGHFSEQEITNYEQARDALDALIAEYSARLARQDLDARTREQLRAARTAAAHRRRTLAADDQGAVAAATNDARHQLAALRAS